MAAMLAAACAGCTVSPFTYSGNYPVYDNPVNPTPAPGYRVVCGTGYGIGILAFPSRTAHCTQIMVPVEERVVVRVRG